MRPRLIIFLICAGAAAISCGSSGGGVRQAVIEIDARRTGPVIDPMLRGVFFEEINHAGDGGLFAELVHNRSFEHADLPEGWQALSTSNASGRIEVDRSVPLNSANIRSLRVTVDDPGTGRFGAANLGYFGNLAVQAGALYSCSFSARALQDFTGELEIRLETAAGTELALERISGLGQDWQRYQVELLSTGDSTSALLTISTSSPGRFWLDAVSLIPEDAPHGLRPDLIQMLSDLRPAFFRFPGGCFVEGDVLANAWRWKGGVGPQESRRTHWNFWGYHTTNGLGLHEYLLLCELLETEPILVVNCGMSRHDYEIAPLSELGPWVQDALDAIEYASGETGSGWGAVRAQNGHPEPFNLKYIEIGNENWSPKYHERYQVFHDAIKAQYPDINIIACNPDTTRPADFMDEHYYADSDELAEAFTRYDDYDRGGPRLMIGEYAAGEQPNPGNLRMALSDAAFMLGMENNADLIAMASYAPLFAHTEDVSWVPNLIYFDATIVYGTPSYHVHQLLAHNRGDQVVWTEARVAPTPLDKFKVVATREDASGDLLLKAVNLSGSIVEASVELKGVDTTHATVQIETLTSADPEDQNTLEDPRKVVPSREVAQSGSNRFDYFFTPHSLTILRFTH